MILAPHFLGKSYEKSRAENGQRLEPGLENFDKVGRDLIMFPSYFSFSSQQEVIYLVLTEENSVKRLINNLPASCESQGFAA